MLNLYSLKRRDLSCSYELIRAAKTCASCNHGSVKGKVPPLYSKAGLSLCRNPAGKQRLLHRSLILLGSKQQCQEEAVQHQDAYSGHQFHRQRAGVEGEIQ